MFKLVVQKTTLILSILLILLVVILDQSTKHYFKEILDEYQQIVVVENYFNWIKVYNDGAAFSFLSECSGWQRWFLIGVSVLVTFILVKFLLAVNRKQLRKNIALGLLLGGTLGNLIDRILEGHVIDFILIHWKNIYYFPAFNIADMSILLGIIFLYKVK